MTSSIVLIFCSQHQYARNHFGGTKLRLFKKQFGLWKKVLEQRLRGVEQITFIR